MSISEKIKAINNKTKQNKDQYNLDRQTAKIYVLPEKELVENAATMKSTKLTLQGNSIKN